MAVNSDGCSLWPTRGLISELWVAKQSLSDMYINGDAKQQLTYDAIVKSSGISRG